MRRPRDRQPLWDDMVWPWLTGVVVGIALWAEVRELGPAFVIGVFALVEVAATPVAVDLAGSFGQGWRRTALVRVPLVALGADVAIGLVVACGLWALPVLVVGTVTSPPVRSRLLNKAARAAETARTRRTFEEIVAREFARSTTPDDT